MPTRRALGWTARHETRRNPMAEPSRSATPTSRKGGTWRSRTARVARALQSTMALSTLRVARRVIGAHRAPVFLAATGSPGLAASEAEHLGAAEHARVASVLDEAPAPAVVDVVIGRNVGAVIHRPRRQCTGPQSSRR